MVAELSIMNETNQNNSMNETAEEEDIMMEVDGHANNTSAGLSKPLDDNVGDENDASITVDKIREYFMKDAADAGDAVDTVIIFDTLETVDTVNTDDTTDAKERCDFTSLCVIGEYLESEDFKPILELTQEQLLVDWLTSRHLLTKNDFDE